MAMTNTSSFTESNRASHWLTKMLVLIVSHLPKCEIIYPLAPHVFSLLSVKPSLGNYCPVDISHAVPKPDGGICLIHDLSRATGQSVNTYASKDYSKYESLRDALSIIQPGWFMAILDLKSAYRSVHIGTMEHAITGLQWEFHNESDPILMCDTRLSFGARKSLAIFNRITQAMASLFTQK